ncbi:hypothetical protein [Flavonifractor sp. An306]|uniref:hypothetical protein n=1 Tax=Flavonifractor sp. An306 TaxID=1965629 RepID=UPI00174B8794|nr:hypothetical protein [Flavonifractor sp. An306]
MELKKRMLAGDPCTVAVYNGKMRFLVTGCLYRTSPCIVAALNRLGYGVQSYRDHSLDVSIQTMVPWDLSDSELEEACDNALNRMEQLSGGAQISSSAWYAGQSKSRWDWAMSPADQALLEG